MIMSVNQLTAMHVFYGFVCAVIKLSKSFNLVGRSFSYNADKQLRIDTAINVSNYLL